MAKEIPVDFIVFSAYPDDDTHVQEAKEFAKKHGWTQDDVRIVKHRGGVHVVTKKCIIMR